ncbi:NitT/TauT family transport system substrate-binding protein [Paraburkholderia unamae]|uniref:ABC transporter substrate-binding protein n=1 Tax=Paraburkholderia unamae TaxID=219649 RepID=UPI000DC4E8C5|nr:ABC transporter substrate-binding protein [Paraburkholderia unamae]RAR54928.1 NitT/TauT family transport system substrate-binding protein [Paraburkholderia unamae]
MSKRLNHRGSARAAMLAFALVAASQAAHAEDKTIRVICNNWSGFAPVFVANDLGYFKKLGLKVSVKFDDEQADALAGIAHGDIEVDMRTVDDYQRRPRSPSTPGVMIGTIDESNGGDGVVADGSIQKVSDLKGKVVAMETDIPAYLLLQLELSKAGLSYKDMTVKQTAGSDALSVFSDRNVAAIGTFQPFMNKAVTLGEKRGAHILVSSASYPGTIVDAIIVNQSKLKADPLAYKNFLIGVYKAIAYYNAKPADFIRRAAPHFSQSEKDFKASIDGSLSYTSLDTAKQYFGAAGQPGSIYKTFDTLMKLNLANGASDHTLSAAGSFDGSALQSISAADLK